jgi:hypothetical protein
MFNGYHSLFDRSLFQISKTDCDRFLNYYPMIVFCNIRLNRKAFVKVTLNQLIILMPFAENALEQTQCFRRCRFRRLLVADA